MVFTYNPSKDNVDGDSMAYLDMMERNIVEERRRQRERAIMEEGKALWQAKKHNELEQDLREQEEVRELELREMAHSNLFGKPGHGAPTEDIRKKKFTEYQLQAGPGMPPAGGSGSDYVGDAVANPVDFVSSSSLPNPYRPPQPQMDDGIAYQPRPPGSSINPYMNGHNGSLNGLNGGGQMTQAEMDALTFGRPGCGAPVRTKSGRLRTNLIGNPEIRFQPNEAVKKTIVNTIRYQADRDTKEQYHKALEEQIYQRRQMAKQQKEHERAVTNELDKYEGTQWGRPGPGGPYWRDSAITGQGFFEKMGWSGSGDPRKRPQSVKQFEAEDMKKDMDEREVRRHIEHSDLKSEIGVELVPLLKEKSTGKPRKDPNTGYMLSHTLPSTDVTRTPDPRTTDVPPYPKKSPMEEQKQYYQELAQQISSRDSQNQQKAKADDEQQRLHFQQWDTFWGRPGYGAPREGRNPHKENLMKLLHYPHAKHTPNNVELITLERLPLKL